MDFKHPISSLLVCGKMFHKLPKNNLGKQCLNLERQAECKKKQNSTTKAIY